VLLSTIPRTFKGQRLLTGESSSSLKQNTVSGRASAHECFTGFKRRNGPLHDTNVMVQIFFARAGFVKWRASSEDGNRWNTGVSHACDGVSGLGQALSGSLIRPATQFIRIALADSSTFPSRYDRVQSTLISQLFWRTRTSSSSTKPSQVPTASRRGLAAVGLLRAHFART
jgi:hypothetical protein